jgi:thiol-disulfide isomerase/thioredoxin
VPAVGRDVIPLYQTVRVALLVAAACAFAQSDSANREAIDREIERGATALRQGRDAEAKQHFEEAERMGGPPSAVVNGGIGIAELRMGHYEAARQREAKVLELVSTDHERAEAHNLIGSAWLREAFQGTPSVEKLRAAEESFRRAIRLDAVFETAYFNLGNVLQRQGREADAAAACKDFIVAAARNPAYQADLPLSPKAQAPSFAATDSAGRVVSSDALRGRFVLLDFWATWCAPCIKALPIMRQLAQYFPPGQFTVISLDEDTASEETWKKFIAQEHMDWIQVWDQEAKIYHRFGFVSAPDVSIPRYVLLDGNGFVRRVYNGTDRFGLVIGQIVRTVTAADKVAPVQVPSAPTDQR